MSGNPISLLLRWLVGGAVGTLLIAASSPWFVRSYLPLQVDSTRNTWTLPAGKLYRWRSEGYADSSIGPLGMPGRTSPLIQGDQDGLERRSESLGGSDPVSDGKIVNRASEARGKRTKIALWGDSQVEGVCVSDHEKIFACAERLGAFDVFPLARSGQDAADWLTQMSAVEAELQIDLHVFFVSDLEDLLSVDKAPLAPPSFDEEVNAKSAISAWLPAFVIQGARYLLTEADGATRRRLRFTVGPVRNDSDGDDSDGDTLDSKYQERSVKGKSRDLAQSQSWDQTFEIIRRATRLPVIIFDAPVTPQVIDGQVRVMTEKDPVYLAMRDSAQRNGLWVVTARDSLLASARQGHWPHGFHNGQFGVGHLNATGNAVVASVLAEAMNPMDGLMISSPPVQLEQTIEALGGR